MHLIDSPFKAEGAAEIYATDAGDQRECECFLRPDKKALAGMLVAAVRSKKNATPGQIEGFIRTLIKGKLNDGQFDECELTFRDLELIAEAFARVINGIYHKRIEYPPQANELLKLQEGQGNHDSHHNE